MEISSGDSTPTSESLHIRAVAEGGLDSSNAHPSSGSNNAHMGSSSHFPKPLSKLSSLGTPAASLPSALPGAGASPASTSSSHVTAAGTPGALGGSAPPSVPQLLTSHPRLMALSVSSLTSDSKGGGTGVGLPSQDGDMVVNAGGKPQLEPLTIAANSNSIGAGPPTPTHSENQDGLDIRKSKLRIFFIIFIIN